MSTRTCIAYEAADSAAETLLLHAEMDERIYPAYWRVVHEWNRIGSDQHHGFDGFKGFHCAVLHRIEQRRAS